MTTARAVGFGAAVMLAALALMMAGVVALILAAPDAIARDEVYWGLIIGGTLLVLLSAAGAGAIAMTRLYRRAARVPLAMLGPVAVTSVLLVLPALVQRQWAGAALYETATLAGSLVGAVIALARRGRRAGRW